MIKGVFIIQTIVYFVRHAASPYIPGAERTRGLSEQGKSDATKVKDILIIENIDTFISSPYERAIMTIKELSVNLNKDIILEEDLKKRQLIGEDYEITIDKFYESKKKVYEDRNFSFPGGESSKQAQDRVIKVLKKIIENNQGKRVVIGTHGDIMTLMINYFDANYGFEFWESTSMPDIYKLEIEENMLKSITRLWS